MPLPAFIAPELAALVDRAPDGEARIRAVASHIRVERNGAGADEIAVHPARSRRGTPRGGATRLGPSSLADAVLPSGAAPAARLFPCKLASLSIWELIRRYPF